MCSSVLAVDTGGEAADTGAEADTIPDGVDAEHEETPVG